MKNKKINVDQLIKDLMAKEKAAERPTRGSIPADELIRRLESDPEWVKLRDKREADREKRHQEYSKIERPIVKDLNEAGCSVESVWDLVNTTPENYINAVPVLIHHLSNDSHSDKVRESCARALSKKEASHYFDAIYHIFESMPNTGVNKAKWATANALGVGMTKERIEKALEILFDSKHDLYCKDVLFDYVKRYKIAPAKRVDIEKMLAEIDWEIEDI